jgi:hypothetical protein
MARARTHSTRQKDPPTPMPGPRLSTQPSTHRSGTPTARASHPWPALPVVAASAILSQGCAAFPVRVERRAGAVDGDGEQRDGGAARARADVYVAADAALAVAE